MPPPPTWTPIHLRAESPNTRAAANPVDQVRSSSSGTLPTSTWVPIHKRVSKSPVSQSSSSLVVKSPRTPFVKKDFRDSPVAKVLATSHKQCGKGADAKFRTGLEGSTWANGGAQKNTLSILRDKSRTPIQRSDATAADVRTGRPYISTPSATPVATPAWIRASEPTMRLDQSSSIIKEDPSIMVPNMSTEISVLTSEGVHISTAKPAEPGVETPSPEINLADPTLDDRAAFHRPVATCDLLSAVTNNSDSSVALGQHTPILPSDWPKPVISIGINHTNSPLEQYADSFQRYNNSRRKGPKPPREKQPSGWLTRGERKRIAMTIEQQELEDTSGAALPYDEGGWGKPEPVDWNAANQLLDFEGNIAPPPVEWDSRHQCFRDNWEDFIADYIFRGSDYYVKRESGEFNSLIKIDLSLPASRNANTALSDNLMYENCEIAPKDWILTEVENQPLQSFWKSLVQIVPAPVDEEDLNGDPFWLRYEHGTSMLKAYEHPSAICEPVDESDGDNYLLWEVSKYKTADWAIKLHHDKNNMKESEQKRLRRVEKERKRKAAKEPKIAPPPNKHRPKSHVYLRPMHVTKDLGSVYDIYKHYANNTVYVSDLQAIDIQGLQERFQWVHKAGLPIIVAIERSGVKSRRKAMPENVVGFALADEDEGRGTQHSHVACLEVYVLPGYEQKGIGKNLVDRMLYLLDPMYHIVSDVTWDVNEDDLDYNTPGGKRVVGTVRAVLYYGEDERTRCNWIDMWLKQYGFERQADFTKAGMKLGKWTRQAIWQRDCSSGLDPKSVVQM